MRWFKIVRMFVIGVAALAVVGVLVEAAAGASDRRRAHMRGTLVDAAPYRLHVDCRGHGDPTVVFESGNGGTSLDWALVQPKIAETNRTCSYDRAGYGWSDAAPSHTLARMRRDFDVVLSQAGSGPYVLVAHSFGGLLVLDYATRHPDLVAGLVLVDAADKAVYQKMDASYPQFFRNGRKAALVTDAGSVLTRFGLTRLVRQPAAPKSVARSVMIEYRAVGYAPKAYRAFADDLRAFRSYVRDARDDVGKIPAVVLTHSDPGTLWQGVPAAGAERIWQNEQTALAARLGAKHELAASTHFIQVKRPAIVVSAIRDVLVQIRG